MKRLFLSVITGLLLQSAVWGDGLGGPVVGPAQGRMSPAVVLADPSCHAHLTVRSGYLPGVPVLVRFEIADDDGRVARDLWDAEVSLSVDNPTVLLSTDRIRLINGLGSALVTFDGAGDFTLSAALNGALATARLVDGSDLPITMHTGRLSQSESWSGIHRITGGDFSIPKGVTLTLESGTLVLVDGVPAGSNGIDIDVEGAIRSLGLQDAPVTITATEAGANWGELHYQGAATSTFQYTCITQAGHSPRIGHSHSGPTIRASGTALVFEHCALTDHAGKIMHATSGCDLRFRHSLLSRSVMGPEISGTALLFADSWITEMHAPDDADGIYIHSQRPGQRCSLVRAVVADLDDDGIDTLGSDVTIEDTTVRDCKDKGISVYGGHTTISRCLVVENNQAPEDPTVASIAAKAFNGGIATVDINHTTIVSTQTPGVVDVGVQSHNKYGVTRGRIVYRISNSIIDATDPIDVQLPYLASDVTVCYSNTVNEPWPGIGNISADPLFVDPILHDYRLSESSPSVGTGENQDQGYCEGTNDSIDLSPTPSTSHSLAEDTIWTATDGPYHIEGELIVPVQVSLTIEAGTSVFFDADAQLTIYGRLNAVGTEQLPIRFTRAPDTTNTWNGLQFVNSREDNRIHHAVIEYGRSTHGMVGLSESNLRLDHVWLGNTDLWRIRTVQSNLSVRDCVFGDLFGSNEPPTTDNRSEHIWGSGVPADGWFVIENCVFGRLKGHNDAIDFDGPSRPDAIPRICNNLFMGGGDDALDLEADAIIEGNVFRNFRKDEYNRTPREANVISAGAGRHYVVLHNTFINNEHVAQIKERSFMFFINNTVVNGEAATFYFEIPGQTYSPGRGLYVDSCIVWNSPFPLLDNVLVEDPHWGTTDITIHRSLCPAAWHTFGIDNLDADPLFVDDADFRLQPGSPAIGTGLYGTDRGVNYHLGATYDNRQTDSE